MFPNFLAVKLSQQGEFEANRVLLTVDLDIPGDRRKLSRHWGSAGVGIDKIDLAAGR